MDKILKIFFILVLSPLNGEEISGIPKIIDGDTIYIEKYKIRLPGIDAPEIKQFCKKDYLKISAFTGLILEKTTPVVFVIKKKIRSKN